VLVSRARVWVFVLVGGGGVQGIFPVASAMFIISSLSWIESTFMFIPVLRLTVMLFPCLIINCSSGQTPYTRKQFELNTKNYVNSAHRIFSVLEIKVKQSQCAPIKLVLIYIADCMHAVTLCHTL
jgi:hypothetical protein